MLGRPAAIAMASVVLPAWRGPSSATAGNSANRSATVASSRRVIILAFSEFDSVFARL
jgi:hypothetical protein